MPSAVVTPSATATQTVSLEINTTAPEVEWVEIPNHSAYQASTLGQVRNKKTGKIIKQHRVGNYMRITLVTDDGGHKHWRVCRLMATAFNLPQEPGQTQVDHINGKPRDDRIVNLRWQSPSENVQARIALTGTSKNNERVYLKFDGADETLYFSSISQACRHFERCLGTLWGVYKMAEEDGSKKWRNYTVSVITKEQYDAI